MTDILTHPQAPKGRTEYHRRGELTLSHFGWRWLAEGQPPLQEGWRDIHGGWIRWVWFRDAAGEAHALHVPSYRDAQGKAKEIVTFFLQWLRKHGPGNTPRSSHVENVLDRALCILDGVWDSSDVPIRVLSGAEAVRKRPGFYGLTEAEADAMTDEELETLSETYQGSST